MPDNRIDGSLQEAISVSRLIDSICDSCRHEHEYRTYLGASVEFFDYIVKTGDATKRYVEKLAFQCRKYPEYATDLRLGFVQIKDFWSEIHKRVKPAAEADTLNSPVPLISYAEVQLRKLPGLEQPRLVLFLSPDLNYFHYRAQRFKELAHRLSQVVTDAPPFPAGLALIGVPYSQARGLFHNLLIFHELGHFAFEELNLTSRLELTIDAVIDKRFGEDLRDSPELKTWCRGILSRWCEEIFCDLFALSLIGPAFSFASVELFDVLGLLTSTRSFQFTASHPAEAYRFAAHVEALKRLGWWDTVSELDSEIIDRMRRFGPAKREDFSFPLPGTPTMGEQISGDFLLGPFWELQEQVLGLVLESTSTLQSEVEEFRSSRGAVQECLSVGIVPSAAIKEGVCNPTIVLNAAYCFYLDGFRKLLDNVRSDVTSEVSHGNTMLGKLEMWTLKALEDCILMSRSRGA